MTPEDRVAAVETLGYTAREARFLTIAALHSGYFLRRQFAAFAGVGSGKAVVSLTHKLLSRHHARVVATCHNTHLYHLTSKRLYTQLGEPNSRNRRARTPFATRARLLALDYVLAHPTLQFLATARERVAYFADQLGVSRGHMPTPCDRPEGRAAPRYFTDGAPVGVSADGEVVLVFIDDGVSSVVAFDTFLRHYRALLVSLPRPGRLIYVASSHRNFRGAGVVFAQFQASLSDRGTVGSASEAEALRAYFYARRSYEARDFTHLTKTAMDTLRDGRHTFQGRRYDALYADWQRRGDAAFDVVRPPDGPGGRPAAWTLATWCSAQSYDLFGTVWVAS
jgi:hypothetical protein